VRKITSHSMGIFTRYTAGESKEFVSVAKRSAIFTKEDTVQIYPE